MKNILISVCGLTPQIVTETLYCLSVQQKIKIDELYILTTKVGRDVIHGLKINEKPPLPPLKTEIDALCSMYKLQQPEFENNDTHIIVAKEESIELPDIRTDTHNILFPNKTSEFIRQLSLDIDNTLYCSISGGRKTMSVHLAFALSLFGREKDKLLHVLTHEDYEFKDFFPKNKKQAKELQLSEIPFVRLRSIISKNIPTARFAKMKYDEIVSFTQKEVKKASSIDKLWLINETKELKFRDNTVKLEPLLFAIYHFFVELRLEGKNKVTIQEITSKETATRILEFLKNHYPYYDSKYNIKNPWWKTGFYADDFRSKRSKINKRICELINDPDIEEEFIISSYTSYANTSYGIKTNKRKFRLSLPS